MFLGNINSWYSKEMSDPNTPQWMWEVTSIGEDDKAGGREVNTAGELNFWTAGIFTRSGEGKDLGVALGSKENRRLCGELFRICITSASN